MHNEGVHLTAAAARIRLRDLGLSRLVAPGKSKRRRPQVTPGGVRRIHPNWEPTVTYIDCYLAPVPRENRAAYEELARISSQIVKEYGALRVVECWLDESGPDASSYYGEEARMESDAYGSFVRAAGAGADETVVISCIEWPDKATRDAGMEKVTSDPRMQLQDRPPAFDGRRLIAGGFRPMLHSSE
jgi:uncharacterized protein YbaA (DUF1428 family)